MTGDPRLLIVSCTRVAFSEFESTTLLGRSSKRLAYNDLVEIRVAASNKAGLPVIYNSQICEENRGKILLFVHDDVWLDDYFVYERLVEALEEFDVVGLAGNVRRTPGQPAWAFSTENPFTWDDGNLVGAVGHGDEPGDNLNFYGRLPGQECVLLDGLFIAARCDTLLAAGVRFDERFAFDFYDMDFCRSAEEANLRIGTWPIAVTHGSEGKFRAPWFGALEAYREKWGEPGGGFIASERTELARDRVAERFKRAFALHGQQAYAQADALYLEILEEQPDHQDTLHFRGVLLHQQGRNEEAVELIRRALALDATYAPMHSNLGVVLHALGRFEEAVRSYQRALDITPNEVGILLNLGNALKESGRVGEAVEHYDRALELDPENVQALLARGHALRNARRLDEALESYDRALQFQPGSAAALADRAGILIELRRWEEAVTQLDIALSIDPANVAALSNRGAALIELKRQSEALASLEQALRINPDSPDALFNLGTALRDLKRPAEAASAYARLLDVAPAHPYAEGYAMYSRMQACEWTDYAGHVSRIVSGVVAGRRVDSPFSFFALPGSPASQLSCARTWAADKYSMPELEGPDFSPHRHERIRIAYLSPDFGEHPVAHSIVDLLESHDKSRFAVHGVSFGPHPESPTRRRIQRACDRFIDARASSDDEVVQKMRDLEIDIAIDLSGYTQGNRAGIFARRAAPVQVGYLGFSGTTGAKCIDYILADGVVIPPGHEQFYSEKAVRLPHTYLPGDRKRTLGERTPTRVECGLPAEGTVFCCFNNSFKITPDVFDIWMMVLKRVDGSVLWLFQENEDAPKNLRLQAEKRGVEPQRLVFARRLPLLADHLARYRLVDLFLDTLPYNAHVTAADALWSGAPVLTCLGSTFVGRVAASLLRAAGLPDLVAQDVAEYEDIACRLGAKPRMLADLKARLAANRRTQPLFQTDRLCRNIELAYERMYRLSEEGMAPEAFDVPTEGNPAE